MPESRSTLRQVLESTSPTALATSAYGLQAWFWARVSCVACGVHRDLACSDCGAEGGERLSGVYAVYPVLSVSGSIWGRIGVLCGEQGAVELPLMGCDELFVRRCVDSTDFDHIRSSYGEGMCMSARGLSF